MRRYLDIFRRGLWENVRFALSAIRDHKLRSGLTTLGIIVGVTTVMGMVAIVSGFNNNVIGNLQAFGANRIEFQKYDESFGPGDSDYDEQKKRHNLTMEDADALRAAVPEALAVSALVAHTDAVLHIRYTGREDAGPFKNGVINHLREHLDGVATQQWRSMVRDPYKRARRRVGRTKKPA